MFESVFSKFGWGFIFIMIDFRIQGVDILPDIVGYFLFAAAFNYLASKNNFFAKGKSINIFAAVLSIFSIYEKPAQQSGFNNISFNVVGFLIGIAIVILNLVVVYNLFMGIKEMAELQGYASIGVEAQRRWTQYMILQFAGFFAFVLILIPIIAFVYLLGLFVFNIFLAININEYMKRCGSSLQDN